MNRSKNSLFKYGLMLVLAVVVLVLGSQAFGSDDEEDGGTIMFTKPVMAVVFEHKTHVGDNGLECDSCHDDVFEMETGVAESNDDFTMKSLYEGKYCGVCHDGDMAFASNTRCTVCHIGVKGYNKAMGKNTTSGSGAH